MALKYTCILIFIALINIGCTGRWVSAACDDYSTCASTSEVSLDRFVRVWTDSELNNYCTYLASDFKNCVDQISCTDSSESGYYTYKSYVGIADAGYYACSSDIRAVFKNNDACISSLSLGVNDLLTKCGLTTGFWQSNINATVCGRLNTWLKCAYNWIRANCSTDVARVEGWTVVKMIRPFEEALSCNIDTSYVSEAIAPSSSTRVTMVTTRLTTATRSTATTTAATTTTTKPTNFTGTWYSNGVKPTGANLMMILGVVYLTMIGRFRC